MIRLENTKNMRASSSNFSLNGWVQGLCTRIIQPECGGVVGKQTTNLSIVLSHPLNKIYLSGFDARRAVPRVFGSLVLRGKLTVAAEGEALFMEYSGAVVAACQLAVFATDTVRGKHFMKKRSSGGGEGRQAGWEWEHLRTKK